jgi:hypothetical protein
MQQMSGQLWATHALRATTVGQCIFFEFDTTWVPKPMQCFAMCHWLADGYALHGSRAVM